jgi:soluble lytic murein transglycosylase-like protein
MFNVRHFARGGLSLTFVVAALAIAASGQTSSSVEQQFAAYYERLSAAADLLASPAQVPEDIPDTKIAPVTTTVNDKFDLALKRVEWFNPLMVPILREQGVPTDFAAIVLVESGGRPTALSRKGALGLWQLMPETARRYGLTVSPSKDERLDAVKATRSATRYLRDLYSQFGDWQLAFAAYNAGEQTVQKAILRSGSHDFRRLSAFLPAETQAYVPAIMAARQLFGKPQDFTLLRVRAARKAQVLCASTQLDN